MQNPAILGAALLCLSAPAQDPWSAWLERLKERREPRTLWTLVLRGQDAPGDWWLQDDLLRRLIATQEFRVERLPEPAARELAQQRGWNKDARWLLLSHDASRQAEGRGRPDGEALLSELRSMGFAPRWEGRERFLREHPEHGPARLEAAEERFRLALNRLANLSPRGGSALRLLNQRLDAQALAQAAAAFQGIQEDLARLSEIPLWWERAQGFLGRLFQIPPQNAAAILGGGQIATMRDQVQAALEREPDDEGLWNLWAGLNAASGRDLRSGLPSALPAPGQAWPPEALATILFEASAGREDWSGALAALDALRAVDSEGADWDELRLSRAYLEALRARALARLGRWEECAAAAAEARTLGGPQWRGYLSTLIQRGIPASTGERKTLFSSLFQDEPPPPPAAPPRPPGLRLLRLGPAWADAWARLGRSAELAPWGPAELSLGPAPPELERDLRSKYGWEGPAWAVLRGEDVLVSGEILLEPKDMAARLEAQGPPVLQRLDRFLERHPEHLTARRYRLDLLAERMPNRHLEARLAEDARRLRARIKGGDGWTPEPGLWQWSALQVLPGLEVDLARWPDRPDLWRSWVSWARLHPRKPSALDLARRLPVWGPESAWSARLPAEVHRAVAEELRDTQRAEEMRQWFQAAWDGVDKTRRGRGSLPRFLVRLRKEQKESIADPLREALVALKRDAEVQALDREVAEWMAEGPAAR
ncbi:MAG: hypothetical protein HY823_00025 [Acidobacteria bacterium]|nr:hypothetical protein [Acidobacteriota bacterium]